MTSPSRADTITVLQHLCRNRDIVWIAATVPTVTIEQARQIGYTNGYPDKTTMGVALDVLVAMADPAGAT